MPPIILPRSIPPMPGCIMPRPIPLMPGRIIPGPIPCFIPRIGIESEFIINGISRFIIILCILVVSILIPLMFCCAVRVKAPAIKSIRAIPVVFTILFIFLFLKFPVENFIY
jgi:hypothetical protein